CFGITVTYSPPREEGNRAHLTRHRNSEKHYLAMDSLAISNKCGACQSLLKTLVAIQPDSVSDRRVDREQRQNHDRNDSSDIAQQVFRCADADDRSLQQHERSERQYDTKFGRPPNAEGQTKYSDRVGREVDFDGKQKVRNDQGQCDGSRHIAGKAQAANKKDRAEGIDNVIDVEP